MVPFRRNSRTIRIGNVAIGGGSPVSIQSMTNTDTRDVSATLEQIRSLHRLGCQIIRVAVPDLVAAAAIRSIRAGSPIPIVADIHFDCRLALAAIKNGADAIRLNPGNLNDEKSLKQVADLAIEREIPIRVGANSGSVRPAFVRKLESEGMSRDESLAEALVESALEQCRTLEKFGVTAIKAALKSSSVPVTIAAYRKFAARTEYPLHIGVTEAGTPDRGIIKSAIGIGTLLMEGIGDTLRVSLTGDPAEEILAGLRILEACGLRDASPEIVSCPTCGRTEFDLISLSKRTEAFLASLKQSGYEINLRKVAIMGCAVNGPGEARDADLGMAGSKNGQIVLFKFGKAVGVFKPDAGFEFFKAEVLKCSRKKAKME